MKIFGFYSILLIGFLGGCAMAWILLCYKLARASRANKNLHLGLLKRLEEASLMAVHKVTRGKDG